MDTPATIGWIGQGYIGKNYADNMEERGLPVVRYALEEPYTANKEKIKDCGVVFIAVPTPTTPEGFDASYIRDVLPLVGNGNIAVIKSTILPGYTKKFQQEFPNIVVLFSPEFLSVASARQDVDNPFANVIGLPVRDTAHEEAAKRVHAILPPAPSAVTTDSQNAEIIKYAHNMMNFSKVIMTNIFFDTAQKMGGDWADIQRVLERAPFVGPHHLAPLHKTGRGAGGYCLPKDFAAFRKLYEELCPEDAAGKEALQGLESKNIELLRSTGKDLDILKGIYGTDAARA